MEGRFLPDVFLLGFTIWPVGTGPTWLMMSGFESGDGGAALSKSPRSVPLALPVFSFGVCTGRARGTLFRSFRKICGCHSSWAKGSSDALVFTTTKGTEYTKGIAEEPW